MLEGRLQKCQEEGVSKKQNKTKKKSFEVSKLKFSSPNKHGGKNSEN